MLLSRTALLVVFPAWAVALSGCISGGVHHTDPAGPRYSGGTSLDTTRSDTIDVVTFNVRYSRRVDLAIAALQSAPELQGADILLLQEMDEPGTRAVAESLGFNWVYYPVSVHPATGRDFGNAVLSRYPLENDRKLLLPHLARFRSTPRAAVGVTIRVGPHRIRVYSVHFATMIGNGPRARREQLAVVLADADSFPLTIMGGDFNSSTVPAMALRRGFTWPTRSIGHTASVFSMDHIVVRGLTPAGTPASGVASAGGASDHNPVWLRLALPATPDSGAAAAPARVTAQTPPAASCEHCGRPRPLVATLEGAAINVMINRFNAWVRGADWAAVRPVQWKRNFRDGFEWDEDQFSTNMFGHPYQGGLYYNAARDNGVGFWGSAVLTLVGSAMWEYLAEAERPSLNDLYMTSFGGVVYGEVGHRIGDVIRDNRSRGVERVAREIAAMPFDPVGGVHRILNGNAARVSADPDDRDRTPMAVEFQLGGRMAIDSGPARDRLFSPTILADIAYGDAFGAAYRQPFDVFRLRMQISPGGGGFNQMRARGRLYGYYLTDNEAMLRHVFTVALKSEYLASPAYKFGGQSLEAGFMSDLALAPEMNLQTELFAEWLLLGGLDAPGSGLRARTYDFGPGLGVNAGASLLLRNATVVSVRWRAAGIRSVSGSRADHSTRFVSVEATAPLKGPLGFGASAGWYRQSSTYAGVEGSRITSPEFRAYLTWRSRRRAAVPGGAPL